MSLWFAETRLEFIREGVRLYGFIGRAQVAGKFKISATQAAKDLERAAGKWPREMRLCPIRRELVQRTRRARKGA